MYIHVIHDDNLCVFLIDQFILARIQKLHGVF